MNESFMQFSIVSNSTLLNFIFAEYILDDKNLEGRVCDFQLLFLYSRSSLLTNEVNQVK